MGRGVLPIFMEVAHEKKTDFDAPGSPCGHGAPANRRFCCVHPRGSLGGEVQIYNGGVEMSYLSINGRIRPKFTPITIMITGAGALGDSRLLCQPEHAGGPSDRGSR